MRAGIVYLFLLTNLFVKAQGGFKRAYYLPGALTNAAKVVFETTPKNYLMAGLVVDTLNGYQFNRLALFGINSAGERTWTKKYGNQNFEYLDALITKWFYRQGDYLYNVCCVRDSNSKQLGVLMKFDLNGDTIWQQRYYDTSGVDVIPQGVTGSVDGGFLITGFSQNWNNHSSPVLIIKTNAQGNELWRKKISKAVPNVQSGNVIIQDSATKKIVIGGYQYVGDQFSWAMKDLFLICDSLGNKIASYDYTDGLQGNIRDMIQTRDKKIVAVGAAIFPQTIGGMNLTRSFIVKFDLNSPYFPIWKNYYFDRLSWANTFTSVKELNNETLLIAGGIDTMRQYNLPMQGLHRISKMSKNGQLLWNRYYNYSTNTAAPNQMGIMSLNLAANGDWLTAVSVVNFPAPNPFYFVRYDSTGCDSSVAYCMSVGLEERKNVAAAISVYPNPIKSFIHLNFSKLNFPVEEISFKLFDVTGRLIKETEIKIEEEEASIPAGELDRGVYFLQLYNQGKLIANKKIVKE